MLSLSNNSGVQRELHYLSGNYKRSPPKFTNLNLESYEGQVILKDKFLSQYASEIRIKLPQLQQQDSAASLDETVQTATDTFYNREQRGRLRPRKGSKGKRKGMAALQGSPMANPETLKDKARGKYRICRQAGCKTLLGQRVSKP